MAFHEIGQSVAERILGGKENGRKEDDSRAIGWLVRDLTKKGVPALTAKVRLPSGEIVDHYDAPYTLAESWSGEFAGSVGGPALDKSQLLWRHMHRNGALTLSLSLNGWRSKPAAVEVSQGKATPDSPIIEMQAENTRD